MVRSGQRLAGWAVAVVALLVVVLGSGQPGLSAGGVLTLVLVAAVVAAPALGPVLDPAPQQPGGPAARALGSFVPLPRQCVPGAAGRARPRAPGVRGSALI